MRCRFALLAGLALFAVSACAQAERPSQLVGALYHGFTLVDGAAGETIPNAWIVVSGGEIESRGRGVLPRGDFITEVDLSGYIAVDEAGQDMTFWALSPCIEMTEGRSATLIMTGGLLSEPTANRAAFDDGADASSPLHF